MAYQFVYVASQKRMPWNISFPGGVVYLSHIHARWVSVGS